MTRRRIALALGAAAGGLLGAWLAPASVAFADSFDVDSGSSSAAADPASYTLDPVKPETVTGIYNMFTPPPGINESLQGYEQFAVMDGSDNLGTVDAYEATSPYLTPYLPGSSDALTSSQVIYVDSQVPGAPDASSPGALPDGSVVSTTWSFGQTFENIYSAIPGATPADDVVTDTLKTPFGNIDLSSLVQGFDASNVPPALPDYISGVGDPTVTSVNGLPPLTIDLQGTQSFDYFDANGNPDGTFTALETTTKDIAGFHTEALLVTADTGSGGNPPPVGSVFNTIDFDNLQNVYSSIPGADGKDVVTDILTNTSTGNSINLSSLFASSDASAGLTDGSNVQSFFDGTGYTIAPAPDAQETFTGVNGLPPGNASIQGTEEFSVYNSSGESVGTFNADVTTIPQMSLSNPEETLLVTSDGTTGTDPVGTAPGDLPPVGSVFDVSYGDGNESVYSDVAATSSGGHDVISDWLATPTLGNFDLSPFYQSTDASNGLGSSGGLASLMDTAWLDLFGNGSADAISNSAANSADALAASVDPSAAASLVDPFPHIDAALQFLAGLF